jgi:hypothetical protein
VPENVWRYVWKSRVAGNIPKRLIDISNRLTIPLDGKALPTPFPAP